MSQSNAIDFRKIAANEPILCIPGVFANIKEERIRRIFADLDLGEVERIDIVVPKRPVEASEKEKGKENKFNRVFIHLIWKQTDEATAARERLLQGKEVKIIYDEPWFWKVSAYKPPVVVAKPKFQPQPKAKIQPKKATLQLDFEPTLKEKEKEKETNPVTEALSIQIPPIKVPVQKKKSKVPIKVEDGDEDK
jgi:hypothetical protein